MPSTSLTSSSHGTAKGILLVEGYGALAIAITAALEKFAPHHGVRVARTLAEAERAAAEMRPELFLLDLDPPPSGDVDFFSKLQMRFPEARVLVVAAGTSPELRAERGTAGAVQFIEKPFELGEFGAAVQALLGPWAMPPSHGFRGTLRDLHVVDIVQLKCLALSTAVVRLETTAGKVGEIHFARGQICHASAGQLNGVRALEEIVSWPGGKLTETELPEDAPKTIDQPWAVLLLQAVRKATAKERGQARLPQPAPTKRTKTILVIDDTEMLRIFVADVLEMADKSFDIVTASTGHKGLEMAAANRPDLILLDYSLTDITGAEVCRGLLGNEATAQIPVLMMSGHLPELANTAASYGNVVATLPKPFLSDALIDSVEKILAAGVLPKPPVPPLVAAPGPISPNGHGKGPAPTISGPPLLLPPPASAPSAAVVGEVKEVSVTFSLEVVSMRLTDDFRMDSLQLKPAEAVVGVHVADEGEMGLAVRTGFRIGPAQIGSDGKLETIILFPTLQPMRLSSTANVFTADAVRAQSTAESRAVEPSAAQNEPMRVHLIAQFELSKVELAATFELAAIVLRMRNNAVHISTGPGKAVAPFAIVRAELDAAGQLSGLLVRATR
ncbi:MAG: response regulator [Chthoniobacterales bacterium]|nr:response regulator [Chthoniobacterales bacterium]